MRSSYLLTSGITLVVLSAVKAEVNLSNGVASGSISQPLTHRGVKRMPRRGSQKYKVKVIIVGIVLLITFLGQSLFPTTQATQIHQDLVGEWGFEEGSRDTSGNGNDGTIGEGSLYFFQGVGNYGNALELNSSSFTMPLRSPINDDLTLGFWVKLVPSTLPPPMLLVLESEEYSGLFWIRYDKELALMDWEGHTSFTINSDEWRHITVVRRDSSCELYVDGSYITSTPFSSVDPIEYFTFLGDGAVIDEISIYNRALTIEEIGYLHAPYSLEPTGPPTVPPTPTPPPTAAPTVPPMLTPAPTPTPMVTPPPLLVPLTILGLLSTCIIFLVMLSRKRSFKREIDSYRKKMEEWEKEGYDVSELREVLKR